MTDESVSAAEAAEKAVNWAKTAQVALRQVDEYRMAAKRSEGARSSAAALHERAMADEFEEYRKRAVDMANMWARVSGALHTTESGGRP